MFTTLMQFLIWIFNVCALCTTAYYYFAKNEVILLLPYLVWTPFDSFRPDIYPFMYLYHVASGYVAMNALLGADLLFSFLTGHLCMHFDLLAQRVARIGFQDGASNRDALNQINNKSRNVLMHKELVDCIQRHKVLIGISEELEKIFSFSIFMNFSGSSVLICLVGFQTTAVTGVALFMFLIFLISMVVQIYQLCDAGHQLIEKSESLSKSIYESDWNNCDRKFKRSAQILMARAQKPQKLTALRFSVVSLTSFGKVMSTSWSYFTLLQTVYQGPKD
ncbi:odorant receptor 4-like [Ctenocephalides felis]|uniref:odorant receptor 4-like n=1 Tax=Ctenocephalides felis TaxID=7515 RepID=UPI000E6E293E|nr:odorant receptor 4-like [Ctenocephalides felis]